MEPLLTFSNLYHGLISMFAGSCGVRGVPVSSTPTVVVIGAGFGGLAAARFLHNSNFKVASVVLCICF